jgi:hypothetical protein
MKPISKIITLTIFIAAISACSSSNATPYPTYTPYPTFTPLGFVSDDTLFEENFDSGNLDKWTIKSGSWSVVDGQLSCVSSHDARIIAGDATWGDYSISADIKPVSGSVDVGIYGRLQDTTHNYQGQLWDDEARIKIWDEDWSDLATADFPASNDTWYAMKLEFQGSNINLYINDSLVATTEDPSFQAGMIGLRCASNSQAYFDNVTVTRLSEQTTAPFPFKLTTEKYQETDNIEFACGLEYGSDWRIADWTDISAYVQEGNSIETFVSTLALVERSSYLVTKDGERWYSGERHYFMEPHNHNLPDGWLSHADIDDHYIDLGSWHGIELEVLCYNSETLPVAQATATSEGLKTPEGPPEVIASYVGTQPCAEWPNYAVFKLESTTMWVIQSAHIGIYDVTNDKVIFDGGDNKPFLKEGECPPGRTILPPYNTRYVVANLQDPLPGTNFAAAITVCTEDDLKGECRLTDRRLYL